MKVGRKTKESLQACPVVLRQLFELPLQTGRVTGLKLRLWRISHLDGEGVYLFQQHTKKKRKDFFFVNPPLPAFGVWAAVDSFADVPNSIS